MLESFAKKKLSMKKYNFFNKNLIFAFLIFSVSIFAEDTKDAKKLTTLKANEFTINYDSVSIIEYIQFVSKVCSVNFIYTAADLNFTISITSKEPITKQSVMSSLMQVLRANGLYLVEDGSSIIISKSEDIIEAAPIVEKGTKDIKNPIITRIFSINNVSPEAVFTIIKAMVSKTALIELLTPTRQLILTDVVTNVEKITQLIENLDRAKSPLVIETYTITANASSTLISLAKEIMSPMIAGNPYLLIPQDSTRKIFIVSTPALATKTLSVFKSLDIKPEAEVKTLENQQIFIYKPVNRTQKDLKNALEDISSNLKKDGMPQAGLIEAIDNMKWISETNSFVFSATDATIAKLQKVLQGLDTPVSKEPSFFLYNLRYVSGDKIEDDLDELASKFKDQDVKDQNLLDVLQTAKWIKETNSILLTGDSTAIEEVKNIISQYDSIKQSKVNFFIYTPKHATLNDLDIYLTDVAKNFKSSGLADPELIDAIHSKRVVSSINSIIFTGAEETLTKVKSLLGSYDVSKEGMFKGTFLMLTPTHVTLDDVENAFKDISSHLKSSGLADQPLLEAIASMRAVPTTNSIIFTGDDDTLKKIDTLFNSINAPTSKQAIQELGKTNFWIYQIQKATPTQITTSIKSITADLANIDSSDKAFISALKSMKYVKETNSIIFVGTPNALKKIEPLVQKFDIAPEKGAVQSSYYVYKPIHLTGPELECILCEFAENLKVSNLENEPLYETIESMKYSEQTNTLVFTGEPDAITEIKKLLQSFDVTDSSHPSTQEISGLEDLGFLVYKLQYHKGDEIQGALKQIGQDLKTPDEETATKSKLVSSIDSLQWIKITNSLLCTGDKETLAKMKELLSSLDVPLKQVFIEILVIQTTLTNVLSFGLDWGSKFQYKDQAVLGVNNFQQSSPLATPFNKITNTVTPKGTDLGLGDGFNLGVIGDILFHKGKSFLSLASLLSALQKDTETSIVLTPKIIAQDGKTATIFSGQNIPYTGSIIQNQGANTSTSTNLEYRDVGTNLSITPILGNSDSISLNITLETSATPDTANNTVQLGNITGITTTKTNMTTSVQLANKNFLVLSGMVTDTKNRAKTGIPCLGGIPIIGAAFSKDDDQNSRNNIVIFIRPHIINSFKDMKNITNTQEDFFREQAGTPALERDFDESTELIKSYEND